MSAWTTPVMVRDRARRRWTDGSLLAAYVAGDPCPGLDLPVRAPTARQIGPRLAAVRQWRDTLVAGGDDGRCYTLTLADVGGRAIGRTQLPSRICVATYEQFWRLLGVGAQVRRLDRVVELTQARRPELLDWLQRRALRASDVADEWPAMLAALDWIVAQSGRGRYLREVTAPGVDTKFIERHRRLLDEMVAQVRPPSADSTVPAGRARSARGAAARWGFEEPQRLVQLRLDPAVAALPADLRHIALPLAQLAGLAVTPDRVLIIENQVTFLSVPVPQGGVVVWGSGFDALRLGEVPWLQGAQVSYWGDLDTHGFAILNGLRTLVPGVRSVLMDRATLLAHRDRWVVEPNPTRAELPALTREEAALYEELADGTLGDAVRLEQERIDWGSALAALPVGPAPERTDRGSA